MVKIQEDLGVGGPSHPHYPTSEMGGFTMDANFNKTMVEDKYGFRLQELNHNSHLCNSRDHLEETTSVSGHSNYKQRIDSMFDDSRSMASDRSRTRSRTTVINNLLEDYDEQSDRAVKNNIQEKIEKMFEEISLNGFQKSNSFHNFKNRRSDLNLKSDSSSHDFKVAYLGSKSLEDKNVSLITLQEPLRDLYLDHKKKNIVGFSNILTISKEGLKIKINESVTLNQFPTIAVWASVKFSWRHSDNGIEYAFLPLIKDPDGIDKNMLFRKLNDTDSDLVNDGTDEKGTPPIFFVVMKNSSLKLLECHGFVCSSSEEAIVIAANLYQALMKKMKKRHDTKSENASSTDTATTESDKEKPSETKPEMVRKKAPPPIPARPPRKVSKERQKNEELILELKEAFHEVQKQENVQPRRGSVPNNIFVGPAEPISTLKRSVSERRKSGIESVEGDILTKVAIPRSRSFLNANGPLTRYSRRNKTTAHSDGELTSPLGFNELFNEFRQNEGLENMDDILNAIIDAEGMSFNDLKPIYKEFLLKLAVTLTKDELFQRSKNIMRMQKKKNRSRSLRKKTFVSATGLRKVFRKTASKLSKQKNTRPTTLEFTSVVFQSSRKHFETSTSSTSSSNVHNKKEIRRRQSSRKRKKSEKKINKKLSVTSEDSDCFLVRNGNESGGCPNRSSSGYFSCSECSYDSENCTCTSADKCYCTLGTKKTEKDKMSVSSCGKDTESCVYSEKCYCIDKSDAKGICQTPHLHQSKTHNADCPNYTKVEKSCKKHSPTIFEQLKEQGFVASDSSLSRAASPSTAWRNNEEKVRRPKECLKTSRSLEFLQIRPQRQQVPERPPPPILSEIPHSANYVEGTRHFCYHGQDITQPPVRRESSMSYRTRRQFSSMRTRNPNVDPAASRARNKVFSSMRAKSVHDDIMGQVLFPERNGSTTSSLRFTRRMDVYNSFQGKRCVQRQGSYIDLLNQIQTRFQNGMPRRTELQPPGFTPIPERPICHHEQAQMYVSSGGSDNFQKIDYDLFSASVKSDTSGSVSNLSDRKVLVVSARDPRGKVLYMGASSRGEHVKDRAKDRSAVNASEALSVKKSAEIAALFSDVYLKQKLGRAPSVRELKAKVRPKSYRLSNMENTLGYLP